MVPGVIGYIPEYRGVIGTPRGVNGPHGPKVEKRRGGQGRPRPPPRVPSWTRIGGGGATSPIPFPLLSFGLSPLFPYGPIRPIYSTANSRNSPVLRKIPESLETFPMSEYSRPIYRSLRLDHFETPRHVPDLIRDSKLLRFIKTCKLII